MDNILVGERSFTTGIQSSCTAGEGDVIMGQIGSAC